MSRRCAVVAVACLAVAAGCTERQGPPPQLAVTTSTEAGVTTTSLPGGPEPLVPRTAADIEAELEAAVAARDFCKVAAALDDAAPDTNDGAAVTATYEALARTTKQAAGFVPAELSEAWPIVVEGIEDGVVASRRVGGDVKDPALRAPFIDGSFESAIAAVETWSDARC